MITTLALALLPVALPVPDDDVDLLVLADGKEIECRVLYEDDEIVVARSRRKDREYPRAEVKEIHSVERSLFDFLDRYDKIDPTDVKAVAELALFCEAQGLAGEARNLWIRTLMIDAENEQAWTKLGGVKNRKGWRIKVRGRYYTLAKLRERVSDWKNAMELPTAHFLVKTDISPERALDVTLDLERAYRQFHELMNPHLKLFVFDEIPEVHIYSDFDHYPTPPTPRDAWFSRSSNTVFVNGSTNDNIGEIVQEFTHLLIFNAFHRTLGKTGSVAAWTRDAIGQAFAIAARPDSGHIRWEFGKPYMAHFRFQANDEDPIELKEVLRASRLGFDGNQEAQRNSAGAYTLMYFLCHAEEQAYLPRFIEYMKSSYVGKGSAGHFEKIMDEKLEDIEAKWRTYVKEVAGA